MSGWLEACSQDPASNVETEALRREMERLAALVSRDRSILDALLNHTTQGIFVCDAAGRITLVNRAAERIWAGSITADDRSGWAQYRMLHADGRPVGPDEWSLARAMDSAAPVDPEEVEIERFDGQRAVILIGAAPIFGRDGDVAGAVSVFADVTSFRERERDLLARQRRAATRLARLQALTAGLSEAATPRDVARVAVEHVRGALGARAGGVWTLREDGSAELLEEIGFAPEIRALYSTIASDTQVPLMDALRSGEPLWFASRAELEARYPGVMPARSKARAVACLPMTVKGQCIGVMSFSFTGGQRFADDDRTFLLVAVRHGAQALERARLYEAERTARAEAVATGERTSFLYEASTVLASSLEFEVTLASVARLAVPRVADWCIIDLAEDLESRREPVVVAHHDPAKAAQARELARRFPPDPGARTGSPAVVRTGRPELHAEMPDSFLEEVCRTPEHLEAVRALGFRSAMIVPMLARGRTLGAITFAVAESDRRYAPADLEMAQHLARRAGFAIDNARLYRQAQQAIRAREEIVAVVSHDLKNPLNAILMSSGLLRRSSNDQQRIAHHADSIERSVHRMRSLVSGLLDLARLEGGRFPLDRKAHAIAPVIAEAIGVLQPLGHAKRLTLDQETADEPQLSALCDRERVLQVLSNLLGNAIQFCPEAGRVTVRARRSGADILISVSDTGPGIPADEQRLVFDRFWKSRSSGQGTGLGLSIAKGIVEAHGGHIWVESQPGAGATFSFTLPAA